MLRKLFISAVAAMALVASAAPGSAYYRYRVGPGAYYGRPYYRGYAARPYYRPAPYYGGYYGSGYYNPGFYGGNYYAAPYVYPNYGTYYGAPAFGVYGQTYFY